MEIVDEVVEALLGVEGDDPATRELLSDQVDRAAETYDARTAESISKALVERLTEDPSDLRELETLLILGLAHPTALEKHRVPILQEGRRLSLLLERSGDVERAQSLLEILSQRLPDERSVQHDLASFMRRTGNSESLVDRYLRSAEEAIDKKQISEAIAFLQEALMVDRSRRDVARMIRDLRYQQADRRVQTKRRAQLVIVSLVVIFLTTGVVVRERSLTRELDMLGPVQEADLDLLQERLSTLDMMISDQPLWVGVFRAQRERVELQKRIGLLQTEHAENERRAQRVRESKTVMAEAARQSGRENVSKEDLEAALLDFQEALRVAPKGWEYRGRTENDVRAIEEYLQGSAR